MCRCDIVQVCQIARQGTAELLLASAAEPRRFSERFYRTARADSDLSRWEQERERACACLKAVAGAETICIEGREDGFYATLYALSVQIGGGFTVELERVLLRQETIELCEQADLDPYRINTRGCLLVLVPCETEGQTELLLERLAEKGLPAAVIGSTTRNQNKIVRIGVRKRYIGPERDRREQER